MTHPFPSECHDMDNIILPSFINECYDILAVYLGYQTDT